MRIQHFRVAHHAADLERTKVFYSELLGFSVIGSFEDHNGFCGVILGLKGQTWHLEFTTTKDAREAGTSAEAIMVFYHETMTDYEASVNRFEQAGASRVLSKNPYWEKWGRTYLDPDGHRIVLCKRKW